MSEADDAVSRAKRFMGGLPPIVWVRYGSWRKDAAVCLHHLSIEHHSAIVELVDQGHFSSAYALFRPQIEAWLRGHWALSMASEDELRAFVDRTAEPPLGIKAIIEKLEDSELRAVTIRMYHSTWRHLCDYTHGGGLQLQMRSQQNGIQTIVPPESLRALVDASTRVAYFAAVDMAEILGEESLVIDISDLFVTIYPPATPTP